MPLDGNMGYQSHTFDDAFLSRATWTLEFAWWPRRCMLSKRLIWLERAYCGVGIWTGPGENVIEVKWANEEEFFIWALTK
jgi:hypothetical protein